MAQRSHLSIKKDWGILVEAENVEEKFILVIGIGINFSIVPKEGHWGDLDIDDYQLKESFISELIKNLLKDIVDDPSLTGIENGMNSACTSTKKWN